MSEEAVGLRIQLTLLEDGTAHPPELPAGTVVRRLLGPDRNDYFEVRLDRPVECIRATTGQSWILHHLTIVSRYGNSLALLRRGPRAEPITVGVANIIEQIPRDDPMLDLEVVEYFATAEVRAV